MKHIAKLITLLIFIITMLSACGNSETNIGNSVSIATPNSYLRYINRQASLSPGTYTIVAATVAAGQIDSFIVTVTYDDGSTQNFTGDWTNSGGMDAASADNPNFSFTLNKAGGIKFNLTSNVDNYLYLLDRSNKIIAENDNQNAGSTNASIDLPTSRINNEKWTNAYYAAIDPANECDTLTKWKAQNGFDDSLPNKGADVHVIFRDTRDLGYGRSMYARRNANGCVAFFVENFFADIIEGWDYNTLNLTAAVDNNHTYHFGANAIEFSDLDGDCDGADPMFNKFYTFKTDPNNHENQTRLTKVDLNRRGEIFMPTPCIVCHGGQSKPLLADGTFNSNVLPGTPYPTEDASLRKGDTGALLQPFDVDDFEFTEQGQYSKAAQLAQLRELNDIVYSTYPVAEPQGKWHDHFLRNTLDGWYGGVGDIINPPISPTLPIANFDGSTYVPDEWKPDPNTGNPPAGSDQLFLQVIKPYCFACHSKMGIAGLGTDADVVIGDGKDIDFSTYKKFISHEDQIEDYVFRRGLMPLSLLTYDKFWASDAPDILASFLASFTPDTTDGKIDQPGKPIANAGLDRTSTSPVTLDGNASLFSDQYSWLIISTPPSSITAALDSSTAVRPVFTADVDGTYIVQLTSQNSVSGKQSAADDVIITIDSAMNPAPKDITFDTHIRPILDDLANSNTGCAACHHHNLIVAPSSVLGIPVFYNTASTTLYTDIIERINFAEPGLSPLLLKPTGHHHYGGTVDGFDLNGDQSNYDIFVNWVLEGAREN